MFNGKTMGKLWLILLILLVTIIMEHNYGTIMGLW
jgi:hypothetical protein